MLFLSKDEGIVSLFFVNKEKRERDGGGERGKETREHDD